MIGYIFNSAGKTAEQVMKDLAAIAQPAGCVIIENMKTMVIYETEQGATVLDQLKSYFGVDSYETTTVKTREEAKWPLLRAS